MGDFVSEPPAAPVLGLLDVAVQAGHNGFDLFVQFGDLLFGGVAGKDVNELVLSICHLLLLQDTARATALVRSRRLPRIAATNRWQGCVPLDALRAIRLSPDRRR